MADISIYIVEDEPLYAGKEIMLIEKLGYQVAGKSKNSDTALSEILNISPDLLLVDINIEGSMDGIQLVQELHKKKIIPSIFVTSLNNPETFDRAKQLKPHSFITKPFNDQDLQRSIELALANVESDETDSSNVVLHDAIFIKSKSRLTKVQFDDILFLEVEDKYITLFTSNNQKHIIRMSLTNFHQKTNGIFVQTHRKHSVNLSKISSIDLQDFTISIAEHEIPIGRAYKDKLIEKLGWVQ